VEEDEAVTDYAASALGIAALALGWACVQRAWRRSFPGGDEPDALALRPGCHGCEEAESCGRGDACGGAAPRKEGER
jgi:hypothetical protein